MQKPLQPMIWKQWESTSLDIQVHVFVQVLFLSTNVYWMSALWREIF